jgi:glycosyltransferase involved in cell wall biosynthesis
MQTKKTIVLALVRYYLPGHKSGGPVRSIANMVAQLGDEFDFRIVTSDRDSLDEVSYVGVIVDAWNQVGKAQVYYLSPGNRSMTALARLLSDTPCDVLYLNSFFDPVFTLWPMLARRLRLMPAKPVVIAPRGEFSSGALLIKHWKKAPYKWFAFATGLYRDLTWHASSEHEAADIRHAMFGTAQRIAIASDMASISDETKLVPGLYTRKSGEPLRIIFLSRIAPMKNLDFALKVLAKVNISVFFTIYGPQEDESYWRKCEELIGNLHQKIVVRYEGAVDYSQVADVLENHDLFFLPTRGENYGHVIMESLSAGTPVLIANTTPWRDLEQAGVGWDLPLDNEQLFADKIHAAAKFSNEEYGMWKKKVRAYARERAADPEIIAANRRLFKEAAGEAAPRTDS